ncbi:regulatory protein RecX [Nitrincola tapanii]|uniref:Regulatory protein RecX n=1 Tax=Nitrincola tapanii TaxID=1708751 RepID=A0A5A9W3A8_9GAMM|nr:regulatory protein RecX [Nitrincola tapanii]KAA0874689.1 regulatory protein RecX [Nitrincola tapanii]
MKKSQDDAKSLQERALRLLARREYSYAELMQRLSRFASKDVVEEVLDHLSEAGYQSDQRFAEVWIRNRLQQYQGEQRIRYELRQKGIARERVDQEILAANPNWPELAAALYRRKYGEMLAPSREEQAKRMRSLLNAGFSYDQVREALKHLDSEAEFD